MPWTRPSTSWSMALPTGEGRGVLAGAACGSGGGARRRVSERRRRAALAELGAKHLLSRYAVNLIVDQSEATGAAVMPIDPSVDSLVGRIEHRSELGTLVGVSRLIKAGWLRRANGGCLILDLRQLLTHPHAWEALKRALFSREVIESLGQMLGLSSTATLEPEPIPLKVKVVVIGNRSSFICFSEFDSDVGELFKVVADFDDRIERTRENALAYARLIATVVRRDGLRPSPRDAVARVIEAVARATGDSRKLVASGTWPTCSTRRTGAPGSGRRRRCATWTCNTPSMPACDAIWLRERLERILPGRVVDEQTRRRPAQVNGLAVLEFGGFAFGMPTRITATAPVVIDGPGQSSGRWDGARRSCHSKGVLMSPATCRSLHRHIPLSLSASLVFEQSYSGVEGDSASLAELVASFGPGGRAGW